MAALVIGPGGGQSAALEEHQAQTIYVKGAEISPDTWSVRSWATQEEVESRACRCRRGSGAHAIEKPHISNPDDGIARMEGYVIDVEGGGRPGGPAAQGGNHSGVPHVRQSQAGGELTPGLSAC